MRIFLPLSCVLILLASCTRYQYATINSDEVIMNDDQDFVVENDTLLIRYNFNGENAPVRLFIQNKLNVPVFVDWRQSALIVNNSAISYMPNSISVQGVVDAGSWNYARNASFTSGTLSGTATLPATTEFLPPQSYITKVPMGVTNRFITNVPDRAYKKTNVYVPNVGTARVKLADFTKSSSPLRFRSYITLMVGEAGAKPVVCEHEFYISQLVTTGFNPRNFWPTVKNKGNRFYMREITGFGAAATGFAVLAGTALITGAVDAAVGCGNSNCKGCDKCRR